MGARAERDGGSNHDGSDDGGGGTELASVTTVEVQQPLAIQQQQPSASVPDVSPLDALPWLFINDSGASILTLSVDNLKTMMRNVHEVLKPYLTADLLSRHPGECASHDHTFRLSKTALGDATAYSFMMGEDHSVFWHGAVKTTAWSELRPALERCQKRFERLGVSGQLKYWWDDLCCSGASILTLHVVVEVFPGVQRCPYKDGFHGCHLVTSTFNVGTGDVDIWSRDVGQQLRPLHEPDVKIAVDHLMSTERLSATEARREVLKRYRGKGILRTYGPQPEELESRWDGLIDRMRNDREVKGMNSIVKQPHGQVQGTIQQAESMRACIKKGCYSYPMPIKKMYIPYKRMVGNPKLIHRIKKSESVKNETLHQGANRLVQDISRMGEDLLDIRIDFFVLAKNLKADERRGLIDSARLGMTHELIFINQAAKGVLTSPPFPRAEARMHLADLLATGIDETSEFYEPHGFSYYKVDDKRRNQALLQEAREATAAGSSEQAVGSSEQAAGSTSTRKRRSAAHKVVKQNVLNAAPLKPATAAEIELMLKVVQQAKNGKGKKSESVWARAANLYGTAFIENCAVAEESRVMIRSTTTAEMIKEAYEAMAASQREFVGTAAAAAATPEEMAAAAAAAAAATTTGGAMDDGAPSSEGAAEAKVEAETKLSAAKGRKAWQDKIAGGRAVCWDEVDTLGAKALGEYLLAMGEFVGRDDRTAGALKERVKSALQKRKVRSWSVADSEEGRTYQGKYRKS